ncbi:hypothetical protein D3C76_33590 [compost metagenome]
MYIAPNDRIMYRKRASFRFQWCCYCYPICRMKLQNIWQDGQQSVAGNGVIMIVA